MFIGVAGFIKLHFNALNLLFKNLTTAGTQMHRQVRTNGCGLWLPEDKEANMWHGS